MKFFDAITNSGGEIYEVGGPVRDRLLGRTQKDHDLLVRHLPIDDLKKCLKPHGQVHLVGKSFGIIKFKPHEAPEQEFDIALPRKETSTGLGHRDFEVNFDPELPLEDDLLRRDFTINAMAWNIKDELLIDPFGGARDLQDNCLRQVHPDSFVEDPLRLLRAIQFAARFQLTIEPVTWAAMQEHAALINTVSAERVVEEIAKLMTAPVPSMGFCLMRDCGLLAHVFPELQKTVGVEQGKKREGDDVFIHTMRVLDAARDDVAIPFAGDMELLFAALFHDVGKPQTKRYNKQKQRLTFYGHQYVSKKLARRRMNELKITTIGVNPDRVLTMVENHMFQAKSFFSEKAIRRFIRHIGEDLVLKLVDLRIADNRGGKYPDGIGGVKKLRNRIAEELRRKPPLDIKDLAIGGHELQALGITPGPQMGALLKALLEIVLDDPARNTPDELTRIVQEELAHASPEQEIAHASS